MKTVVLERVSMTEGQRQRLTKVGPVDWFDSSTEGEASQRVRGADIVVVDWVDPSSFLMSMKSPSLIALMSTGYDWIRNAREAGEKRIWISNNPSYATEAVAEHIMALILAAARGIPHLDRELRKQSSERGVSQGVELQGKRMGVIGPGRIGSRVMELARCFGMDVVASGGGRSAKKNAWNVDLNELLTTSDVVAITCSVNESSRGMLGPERIALMKRNAVLAATTWGIIDIPALIAALEGRAIAAAALDVAVEGGAIDLPASLLALPNVILTPHVGFSTSEAKIRQVDTLIANIESFVAGNPKNVVNNPAIEVKA